MRPSCLILLSFGLTASALADEPVDYLARIKPIFAERCFACHGALKQQSGLRLDTAALMQTGGDGGPAVVPGKAGQSLLVERISAAGDFTRMPPEGKPLTPQQIALIAAWIDGGAKAPADEQPEEDPFQHWAFVKPVRPPVPQVNNAARVRNPVDAFIAARYEERGLTPTATAPKHILLRRVYLDLIGLPPSRQQLHAFLADDSPDAYEQVVDRLLDSPQYGERWARHWMDVWRYSDWYGRREVNDVRNSYPHIWRWRDWIVSSLNDDKGYDRMVVEMLAADEAAPTDDKAVAATGFLVRNWFSLNYDQWMKDLVEHTGKAFLALRLNCAHCHDHKYDPISQEEYFRFRAFFEPLELRHDRVPGGPPLDKYVKYDPGSGSSLKPIAAGLARVFDTTLEAETYMYRLGDARDRFDRPPVSPATPALLGFPAAAIAPVPLPPQAWYPGLKEFVQREELAAHEKALSDARAELRRAEETAPTVESESAGADRRSILHPLQAKLANAEAQLAALKARIAADNARYLHQEGDVKALSREAAKAESHAALSKAELSVAERELEFSAARNKVMESPADSDDRKKAEAEAKKAEMQLSTARQTLEQVRKDLESDADRYSPLSPQYPAQSSGRRTALAHAIASDRNPLTARVAVNHIWMRHFGRPLVESVFDFGRSGKQPTHPQLLDWLAVEFMWPSVVNPQSAIRNPQSAPRWSMKHLHRLIVTSNTYRLHSQITGSSGSSNLEIDRDNHFLWRFEPRRMEAEVIRDSILHAAGALDPTVGGEDIDPKLGPTTPRRSLYFTVYPEAGGQLQFAALFDPPDPGECYRRTDSVVPQQALALTNSDLSLQQGRLLARRLWAGVEQTESIETRREPAFIAAAFEHLLSRLPTDAERTLCVDFLAQQRELFGSAGERPLKNPPDKNVAAASTDPPERARESLVRTLFSHNDFVTIR